MINEFKYGQTWKIWPSTLSLSLYSTIKSFLKKLEFTASWLRLTVIIYYETKSYKVGSLSNL